MPRSSRPRRPLPTSASLSVGTLFGGGGGWDLGAWAAGLDPRWSVERDKDIAAVQRANFRSLVPDHRVIVGDVREIDPSTLEPVDILLASPVCKAHSAATSRIVDVCDREDAWTGTAVIDYVRVLKPRAVLLENAPLYVRHPSYKQIVKYLAEAGYQGHTKTVDANWCGVPSSRLRMVSVWTLGMTPPSLPVKQPGPSWLSALEDLLPTFAPSKLAPWQTARIDRLIERGRVGPFPWLISSNNVSTPAFAAGRAVKVARFANEPGFTIVATIGAQSQMRVLHEDGSVQVVNERGFARLQSFPDWYKLPESKSLAIKVIGNAVPPAMSAVLLEAVAKRLR